VLGRAEAATPCQNSQLMFVLTKEEKRVVCFVLLALVVGLGVKEYRRVHSPPNVVPTKLQPRSIESSNRQITPLEDPTTPSQFGHSQLINDDPNK